MSLTSSRGLKSDRSTFLLITIIALGLYLPFLSIQYDTNGILEASAVESRALFDKNHMLYRPLGFICYRLAQSFGYAGNSYFILQVLNAFCGALGVGLAYLVFRRQTNDRAAAIFGAALLATSYVYWFFSTDVFYITLAAVLAAGSLACASLGSSTRWAVAAGVFAAFSMLTWQASMFLVPAVLLLFAIDRRPLRDFITFAGGAVVIAVPAYVVLAFSSNGLMSPLNLWRWFTSYGARLSLPMWGAWGWDRVEIGAKTALTSIVALPLGIWPNQITKSTQLGRIAVDIGLVAFFCLLILAFIKARGRSFWFLLGYLFFMPFIIWWDPFPTNWFFIPNMFLAGFLASSLRSTLHVKFSSLVLCGCVLAIAIANFVTTIRPRHARLGPNRELASCVAEHMKSTDLFLAAQWGWFEYIPYVHHRTALNFINETVYFGTKEKMLDGVKQIVVETQRNGGEVYIEDPQNFESSYVQWLEEQTRLNRSDLAEFGGTFAFQCANRAIQKLPDNARR
jgi:hypothetical protein